MADETVYRLIQGDGVQLVEDAGTATVTISVPGLTGKVNVGDIVQATEGLLGIIRLATVAEVRAGNDAEKAVTPAGLAAAAQASVTDATAGRLMRVGAFGMGGDAVVLAGQNLNNSLPTGFYRFTSAINSPAGIPDGYLIHVQNTSPHLVTQIATSHYGNFHYRARRPDGVWSPWFEMWHAGNFNPNDKANTSGYYAGLTAGNSATLGGWTWQALTPPGMIAFFAGNSAPSGWLAANGAAVSRTTYAGLYAAIGAHYGGGNGTTTFNLPDLRGQFIRGYDGGRGLDPNRPFGTNQSSANLAHSHAASTSEHPGHSHQSGTRGVENVYGGGTVVSNVGWGGGPDPTYRGTNTSTAGAHDHAVSITPDGANESRPTNVALLACIKY